VFEGELRKLADSAPFGLDGSVQAIGNVVPVQCASLWKRIQDQDWETLRQEADRLWDFHEKIERVAIFIAALKGCMALRGWCTPATTRPTRPVEESQLEELRRLLALVQ
jgi:dihydrodipicolinate synthase/N-acetylneuraminate lyase